jgi:lysophospholipase L1-like esterase
MTHAVLGLFIALGLAETLAGGEPSLIGSDVAAAFERASKGAPLRYVALGGSITQAGDGWIGPWLRRQFPNSRVTVVNSGMSATGSALGVFRVERDVIAHQPDLVAIEFCVNDGGLNDEDAVRYLESLIVRLKRLPQPPAIIILEAAAADGVNLKRHRQVARHYDLLEIDLQKAVNDELGKSGRTWDAYFSDDVHPNAEGHSYYARVIEEKLTPFLGNSAVRPETALPPPMSRKPLLMDGRMVAISGLADAPGWKTESSPEIWWNRFFQQPAVIPPIVLFQVGQRTPELENARGMAVGRSGLPAERAANAVAPDRHALFGDSFGPLRHLNALAEPGFLEVFAVELEVGAIVALAPVSERTHVDEGDAAVAVITFGEGFEKNFQHLREFGMIEIRRLPLDA